MQAFFDSLARAKGDTPLLAPAAGKVLRVYVPVKPGDPCYLGSLSCCGKNRSNYVLLLHDDGSTTLYLHISHVAKVEVNQRVKQGQLIALSSGTGCSTGPHLRKQSLVSFVSMY